MKRYLIAAIVLLVLFMACDFAFLDGDRTIPTGGLHYHDENFADGGGYRRTWHDDDEVVQYYEDFFITDGLLMQHQNLDPAEALRFAYAYSYDGQRRMAVEAYYDSTAALVWYDAFSWTAEGNLEVQREYDASGALQWARRYAYAAAEVDGRVSISAFFGPDLALRAAACNDYDPHDRLSKESYFGEDETGQPAASARAFPAFDPASARAGRAAPARSRAILALALPAVPEMPALDMPADAAAIALAPSGSRYWFYDSATEALPASSVAFDAEWYPTALFRSDPAAYQDISVALGYDGLKRISRKRTEYGSVVALDVGIEYDGDTLFPVRVETSGSSLLMPLDYGIEYDADRRPIRVSVSSNGALLHYFTYAYSGPSVGSVEEARSIDPFRFMDELMAANLVISHYDGDEVLIETFTASAIPEGLRVDVHTPEGVLNGYYVLAKDTEGNLVSFSSYSADGTKAWSYSYDYTLAIAELAGQAERLLEYLPEGAAEYANAFAFDLLM